MEAGLIAARFAHYVALVIAFGAFAYGGAPWGEESEANSRQVAFFSGLAVVATTFAVLLATVVGLGGSVEAARDPTLWSAVVNESDFGRVWMVRIVLAVTLVGVAALSSRKAGPAARGLGVLLAGALLTTVALTGHAQVESGAEGIIHRAADAVHLIAAAVWIGALLPFLMILSRTSADRQVERPDLAARRLQAFHSVGLVAVLLLTATGLVNSWFLVGNVRRLVDTSYGLVLLTKLVLFGAMVALAAVNRLRLVPAITEALRDGRNGRVALDRLRTHIRAEFLLGVLVLLAVAVLGAIEPAAEAAV